MRKALNWIKDHFGSNIEMIVTENGTSDNLGNLDDLHRVYVIKHYLNNVLQGESENRGATVFAVYRANEKLSIFAFQRRNSTE